MRRVLCAGAMLSVFICLFAAAVSADGVVPSGTWEYDININGKPAGEITITSRREDKKYLTETNLRMKIGAVEHRTRQTIVETLEFRPLRMESRDEMKMGKRVQRRKMIAEIAGRRVKLITDDGTFTYTMKRDFILDGNWVGAFLKEKGFRKGVRVTRYVYAPSIESGSPIPVTVEVKGEKRISIRGKLRDVIHVAESFASLKEYDLYISKGGVLLKSAFTILNMDVTFEIRDRAP